MIDMLCSRKQASSEDMNFITFSTLLSPVDLKNALQSHNQMLEDLENFEVQTQTKAQEIEEVKQALDKQLKKE